MKQFLCELLFTCALVAPGAKPVEELVYGTVLYDYFQEDYSAALVDALVAEQRNQRGDLAVQFDLAKGSFAFSDGLYAYADDIFNQVPQDELTDIDKMRLAFHLAREYHRRGDYTVLAQQLAKIDLGKNWRGRIRTHPEVDFMRAEVAVQNQDFAQAEALYAQMAPEHALRAYGLFNLGVAYRDAQLLPQASQTFQKLAQMPAYTDEAFDLGQRARLALALLARQQKNTTGAETVLADLPGEGRYQDVAMAAYGGLAMDTENYELAARIWMTLQEQEYWTPSTATARLGFPLSLEKLANQSQRATTQMALLQYQAAEQSFSSRLASLTSLTNEASDPEWVRGLLDVFAVPLQTNEDGDVDEEHQARMQSLMQAWEEQLGHTDWLEWLATDKVHQVLVQWRELNSMEDWLDNLPDHVSALQEVADERQARGEQAKQMLVGDGLLDKREALEKHVATLADSIRAAGTAQPEPTHEWMFPLADSEERALLDDLGGMREMLVHMSPSDQIKWQGRIARLEGVLFFQIVEEQAKRSQALRKQHQELAALLEDSGQRVGRVEVAEDQFVAGVGTDFMSFVDRAGDITDLVRSARGAREEMLAAEIRGRMHDEMKQVEQYLLVTRIAIARATDQLAQVETGKVGAGR